MTASAPAPIFNAMTVPSTFIHASRDLERFLLDVRDEMNREEPLSRMGEGQG